MVVTALGTVATLPKGLYCYTGSMEGKIKCGWILCYVGNGISGRCLSYGGWSI